MQSEQIQMVWIPLSAAYFLQTGGILLCRDVHHYNKKGGSCVQADFLKYNKKQN